MSEIAELSERVEALTAAVHEAFGTRLSRAQVCERLRVCEKTLRTYVQKRGFPCDVAGHWRLKDVIEWERSKAAGNV